MDDFYSQEPFLLSCESESQYASLKFMRGMADMRKIWHDTSYLSAYNSEFMWIWKLNHCCCEFLKCHWRERIASIQQPPL